MNPLEHFEIDKPIVMENIPKERPNVGKLTVTGAVYYYFDGIKPSNTLTGFEKVVHTEETIFEVIGTAGPQWTKLKIGWIEKCSMMILKNNKTRFDIVPTPEERVKADSLVLELGYGFVSMFEIPPGEDMRGTPKNLDKLCVRCLSGQTKYTLVLVPF